MNVGVTPVLYSILKTDSGGCDGQGCHHVAADFGNKGPKPMLFLNIQLVKAGDMPAGSDHHVARC